MDKDRAKVVLEEIFIPAHTGTKNLAGTGGFLIADGRLIATQFYLSLAGKYSYVDYELDEDGKVLQRKGYRKSGNGIV